MINKLLFEEMLWEMFTQNTRDSSENTRNIEVAIFAAKSTFEALELPNDKLIEKIWNCILKMGHLCEPTVLHTALLFFNESATYLIYDKSVIMPTLNFIKYGFDTYKYIPWIQGSIFKCLVEICQNMSQWRTDDEDLENTTPQKGKEDVVMAFETILSFLQENAASIEKDNWFAAMEGICSVWAILEESEIPNIIEQILKIATDVYPNLEFSDFNHRLVLIKSLLMLCGALKALSILQESLIKSTLEPILDKLIDKIAEAHIFYANDKEVCLTICNFYSRWIKTLNTDYSKFFSKTVYSCLDAFASNKENTKSIDVCCLAVAQIGGTAEVKQVIEENFTKIATVILQSIDAKKDADIIKSFANLLWQICKKVSPLSVVNYSEFQSIIILLCEYCMSKTDSESGEEIIFFLNALVCSPIVEVQQVIEKYIKDIGIVLIISLPNMKSAVSQTFAKLLTKIFIDYPGIMQEWCEVAFQNAKFSVISDNIKVNFVKFLVGFRNHSSLFKHTIIIFQSIMKGMSNESEFIGLELKLNQLQKDDNCVDVD